MRFATNRAMTSRLYTIACAFGLFASLASAASLTGPRLLVVLEGQDEKANYSQFFGDLEERGYQLKFESPKSESLSLFTHGEREYDNVILFPPKSKGYGPNLTPQLLLQFANQAGNLLLLTSPSSTPEQTREFARELEISLPPRDFSLVDHFNYDTLSAPSKHDVVLVPRPKASSSTQNYFSDSDSKSDVIAFRGVGHTLGNGPLLNPILTAGRTSYAYDTKEDATYAEDPWSVGSQLHLVSALQARNNARITVSGSAEIFSDEFFGMKVKAQGSNKKVEVANRVFAKEVTGWTFKETGVVKVVGIRHYLTSGVDAPINPSMYRIKNHVTFEIELSEYSNDQWNPYLVPSDDALQLEFTMLDPYYRLPLLPSTFSLNSTTFTTSFKIPDQHGVFAFRVNYKRPFITNVDEKYTVTVRHFAHDEYTRSWDISGAWVWMAGIAVTVAGWVAFCAVWLWSAPVAGKSKGKKSQ
ncbi:oligosaccharyl transferase glycoprotein complex, beta subunit [Maublancomyces gigas]|uniref:Dolichyl-diphosphooligosaccharide--protein glycosyltransferase subunit WBP1 n=1 Tax=Discina gigas TaxID=1032678 RepID=A0ABR3GX94_9PEZI